MKITLVALISVMAPVGAFTPAGTSAPSSLPSASPSARGIVFIQQEGSSTSSILAVSLTYNGNVMWYANTTDYIFETFVNADESQMYMLSANTENAIVHMTAFNATSGSIMWRSNSYPIPVTKIQAVRRLHGPFDDDNGTSTDGNSTDDTPNPSDDDSGPVTIGVTCGNNGIAPTETQVVFVCTQVAPSPPHEGNFMASLRATDGKLVWISSF